MKTILFWTAALAISLQVGCGTGLPAHRKAIRAGEMVLGTSNPGLDWNFHPTIEFKSTDVHVNGQYNGFTENLCDRDPPDRDPIVMQGFGLHFPGFLIGIEKTKRMRLGLQKRRLQSCTLYESYFRESGLTPQSLSDSAISSATAEEKARNVQLRQSDCFVARRLDDHERTFVSHIVQFKAADQAKNQRVQGYVNYDAYSDYPKLCKIYQLNKGIKKEIAIGDGLKPPRFFEPIRSRGWG